MITAQVPGSDAVDDDGDGYGDDDDDYDNNGDVFYNKSRACSCSSSRGRSTMATRGLLEEGEVRGDVNQAAIEDANQAFQIQLSS